MRIFKILFIAACAALAGCELVSPQIEFNDNSTNSVSAVLVIVSDSYIGGNRSAERDERLMLDMLKGKTDDIVILKNGVATRHNVKQAIARACSNELAVVYFTCHGGKERATGADREFEKDGYDEYIFLSDTTITDNELWDIFKTSTNRVFAIFDCCYAGTMFRLGIDGAPSGFQPFKAAKPDCGTKLNLLSWSACSDAAVAYAGSDGGEFTKAIKRTYDAFGGNGTYNDIWNTVKYSADLRKFQNPEANAVGDYTGFKDKKLFE